VLFRSIRNGLYGKCFVSNPSEGKKNLPKIIILKNIIENNILILILLFI
jgi:hypothetical protein